MNPNVVYLWLFLVGVTIFSGLVSTEIFLVLGGIFVAYNCWLFGYTWINRRKIARRGDSKITIHY